MANKHTKIHIFLKGMLSSVQFSRSVVSDSLQLHKSQHARPPCSSPSPGAHSDSRPSSPWYHPAISSSVVPFSSCPQSLPASESFPMSQLFSWGGQSTGASALASFLPKKSQGWSPSEWTGWISLQSKVLSRVFSNTTVQNHQFLISHPYMTIGKTIALTRWTLVSKVMSLLLNILSRLVITFLPRSKCLLISWLQSPSAVILGFPCGSAGKESACNVGNLGSIPGLGRSPGEGKGYPLQYSGLENSMDYTVHGVAKSRTWLSNVHFHFQWMIATNTLLQVNMTFGFGCIQLGSPCFHFPSYQIKSLP